jgi:hypothetical protein
MHQYINETGNTHGSLYVVKYSHSYKTPNGSTRTMWLCRCKCGRELTGAGNDLRTARGKKACMSCANTRHGHCTSGATHEYTCYRGMLTRCRREYAPKGIKVCDRWRGRQGFTNFLADMGPCPSPKHSVDRKDGTKGYSPDNCRWATQREQTRNTCANVWITINGVTRLQVDWLKDAKISIRTYYRRLKSGMTRAEALKSPNMQCAPKTPEHRKKLSDSARRAITPENRKRAMELRKLGMGFSAIARRLGLSSGTIARMFGRRY